MNRRIHIFNTPYTYTNADTAARRSGHPRVRTQDILFFPRFSKLFVFLEIVPTQQGNLSGALGLKERWGAGVETQKTVRGEIGGWGRVPFNEPYAPSLSTIYDGA